MSNTYPALHYMSENKVFDMVIIGAGPSGCTTALNLANTNLKIALIDKAIFPRDKICGDGLGGTIFFELGKVGLLDSFDAFEAKLNSRGVRFIAPNFEALDIIFPPRKDHPDAPTGYVSARLDFDNFLLNQVKKCKNVTVYENHSLKDIKENINGVEISCSNNLIITAKLMIGADGAHSIVAKKLAQSKVEKEHYSAGLRVYYENVSNIAEGNLIELHFYKNIIPGYFWIFPLPNNRANVGIDMVSDVVSKKNINLKDELENIIKNNPNVAPRFKNARPLEKVNGFGLPLGSKKRKISGRHFMLVGDAASLIDPFTGEGISNAMTSGRLAAEHAKLCFQGNCFDADFMYQYDQAVYKKLWNNLSVSYKLQKLLKYPWIFNLIAKKANKNPSLNLLFTNMVANGDIRKELVKPKFYFRLLFP